jgi:tryptophan-rich sensory protein
MSFFVILILIFGAAYSVYLPYHTAGTEWMKTFKLPACTPPAWIHVVAWPCMYFLMIVALWIVWEKRQEKNVLAALVIFALQFFVNISWGPVIVRSQNLDWVMMYMCALFLLVIWNTVSFWQVSKHAGMLFLPYLAWMVYGTWLQAMIWRCNTVCCS